MKNALLAWALAGVVAAHAAEQPYPNRPIRMISPNPAGGANDVIGRIVAATITLVCVLIVHDGWAALKLLDVILAA